MATTIDNDKFDRYYNGDASNEEISYVNNAFCDNQNQESLKSLLSKQFDKLPKEDSDSPRNLDHILYRIHYEINMNKLKDKALNPSFRNIVRWTARIAAIILLPISIFIAFQTYKFAPKGTAWVEIKAPAWSRTQFKLPDGTTGWLNSNSSLKYYDNYTNNRQVVLKGEAFFDVHKDKKRPFMVNTKDVSIKVLGTRFNMATYENEKEVEVVLEEGKLVFTNKNKNDSYTMRPNDMVVYNKATRTYSTQVVLSQKYCSWKDGKLVFRNDPLDVIARRLERWYNVDIEIKGGKSEDFRWRATFIDENLEEVLKYLKQSAPVDYKITVPNRQPDGSINKKKVTIILKM